MGVRAALVVGGGVFLAIFSAAASETRPVSRASGSSNLRYGQDIRPVLSDVCFPCHGPDSEQRQAELRLDRPEGLFSERQGLAVVAPGSPEDSLLYLRISDPDYPMPPEDAEKSLKPSQVELLRQWIEEGASFEEHWAYQRPQAASLPSPSDSSWARRDLDHFVLAEMDRRHLSPSPPAPRETWLRRVTMDLTGLPPTLEEIDAYVASTDPEADQRVVERLLASPRFGEHMARDWMDAARFGDTHGYHLDNERSLWRWRDWVIDAFNRNMPFDQFTVEQLAGDLLENATQEQRIATGFNRCNPTSGEGGLIPEEYLVKYAFDRLETTSTVWLGATMTCARCHDHKYDPISQKDYYRMLAFFRSVAEEGSDENAMTPAPFLKVPTPESQSALAAFEEKLESMRDSLDAPDPELDAAQQEWERRRREIAQARWVVPEIVAVDTAPRVDLQAIGEGVLHVSGGEPEFVVHEVLLRTDQAPLTALRLELLISEEHEGVGRADHHNIVLSDFEVAVAPCEPAARFVDVPFATAIADFSQRKFEVGRAVDEDPKSGWAIGPGTEDRVAVFFPETPFGHEQGSWVRVRLHFESDYLRHDPGRFRLSVSGEPVELIQFGPWHSLGPIPDKTSDGPWARTPPVFPASLDSAEPEHFWCELEDSPDGQLHSWEGEDTSRFFQRILEVPSPRRFTMSLGSDDGLRLWVDGELVLERRDPRSGGADQDRVSVFLNEGRHELTFQVVNFGGDAAFYFQRLEEDWGGYPIGLDDDFREDTVPEESIDLVRDEFRFRGSQEWRREFQDYQKLAGEREVLEASVPSTMVMAELTEPRETRVLRRGQYDLPGAVVEAGVPECLPPLPAAAPRNRLGLARWLVSGDHPLTARVTVNRFWQKLFGRGLVTTPEDFGLQGAWPSHPELLDHLAMTFVESGWDVKQLLTRLATSATYRQDSHRGAEDSDPDNQWLSRGPRHRWDAEVIRDTALCVSDLLVEQVGGKSVKPPQPPGLWSAVAIPSSNTAVFEADRGEAVHRRSLYTFWKRTAPPPTLMLFDAPSRESCTVRRARTNTPLQALALLNEEQFVEAARALGQRLLQLEDLSEDERISRGFRWCTGRVPDAEDLGPLRELLDRQRREFAQDPEAAKRLLSVGGAPRDESLPVVEAATWTILGSVLLNLDETLTKS